MPQELQPVPKILLIKEITLQPNPAKNIVYLSFSAARQYNFTLELFDITGKLLSKKTGVAQTGNNNIPLNVEQFANGLYLIVFNNHKGQTKTIKLVKQ